LLVATISTCQRIVAQAAKSRHGRGRILRVVRFAALAFPVAPETLARMTAMVAVGEVDALVPARVWQEMAMALGEERSSVFNTALGDCGALARLLPELNRGWGAAFREATKVPGVKCFAHR
jgi:tRNA nucleotidyltransferase/poly(A) polymerase